MSTHPVFADDMKEIVESFLVETRELFEDLDNDILRLEAAPGGDLVDQVFRSVHTVKGTAGFLGLEQLAELAHHFEDVLNRVRRGTLDVRPGTVDVLLEAFDHMGALVQQVADRAIEPVDLAGVVARLDAVAAGEEPAPADGAAKPKPAQKAKSQPAATAAPVAAPTPPEPTATPKPAADAKAESKRAASSETIRVPVDRLDALMDLVGELVLSRNRMLQLLGEERGGGELIGEVREATAQLDFVTTELQTAVMQTRMVQIGRVFSRFPRLVRDLSADCGKKIDLVLEGEDTELDKSLTEEIADPLIHIVRNAVDHGIEPPEARAEAGKPVRGTLTLAAAHEGDHILITITDDGGGIDPEKIRAKGVEKGFVTEAEAAEMTDAEVLQMIFRPGFSTAKNVSKVSGRGVGTDVVKTNLTRLNGSVTVSSEVGVGTAFTLKLPLTLAIIQSLLVRAGGETFALPLHAVDEVVGLEGDTRGSIRGREVLRHRDGVVPLVRVGRALDVRGYGPSETEYAVVVDVADRRVGLVVDELVGQKEIVIKPLGSFLKTPQGVAGSAILGDGRVVMVLDLGGMISLHDPTAMPDALVAALEESVA